MRARKGNTRITLATTHKGSMTISEYIIKLRMLGDEMEAVGKVLDDEDMVLYILAGLNIDFNLVASAIAARSDHSIELFL